MCHGHVCTVVVAKVAGTDEIVGGYNPLSWDNSKIGSDMETNNSFIFSLKNGNIQIRISAESKLAKCCSNNVDYEKHIRTTNEYFSIDDYEVFKVIKKQNTNCTIR
ncbi:hypothetical protein Glove_87g83 [Diversispora epigaea]|uniref:TLDc domain-containing protein n=1 Tax=Diversispora epigaea TaxID=1348612 RepID=A0A397J686_9GLOM|nr:hypothetical protein Glove_87g83 [Diversispora epigaea]